MTISGLYKDIFVDDKWSEKFNRGFFWWYHRLRHKVWSEEPITDNGVRISCIRIQTELFENVPTNNKIYKLLSILNMNSSLCAFVYDKTSKKIYLSSSIYVHEQNSRWTKDYLKHAAVIQAAEANAMVDYAIEMLKELGINHVKPVFSSHPKNGFREEPDDMLNVLKDVYAPIGSGPSKFIKRHFVQAEEMKPTPSLRTTVGNTGMSLELPFSGNNDSVSSIWDRLFGNNRSKRLETALLQIRNDERHPRLGSGCLFTLTLPIKSNNEALANELNLTESKNFVGAHGLGGWCTVDIGLTHAKFIPSAMYTRGIVEQMIWSEAMRTQWARRFLS